VQIHEFDKKCREFLKDYVPFHGEDVFVAGGFFPRFYWNMEMHDIDVYVSKGHLPKLLEEYSLCERFGTPVRHNPDYHTIPVKDEKLSIDIISFHDPQDKTFVNKFDFLQCMYLMSETYNDLDWSLLHTPFACIQDKHIMINLHYSLHSQERLFAQYQESPEELAAKIANNLPTLPKILVKKQVATSWTIHKVLNRLQKYIQMGFTMDKYQSQILADKLREKI
jgi:hypothetical protein